MRRSASVDLLGLDLELALVGDDLPGRAGVIGLGLDAVGSRLEDLQRTRLGVVPLALGDHRADAITGDRVADEDHVALEACDARAAERERVDAQVELGTALGTGLGLHR